MKPYPWPRDCYARLHKIVSVFSSRALLNHIAPVVSRKRDTQSRLLIKKIKWLRRNTSPKRTVSAEDHQQIKETFSKHTMLPCFRFGIKSNTSPREMCLLTFRHSDKNNRNNRAIRVPSPYSLCVTGWYPNRVESGETRAACAWHSTKIMRVTVACEDARGQVSRVASNEGNGRNNAGANYECGIVIKKNKSAPAASGPSTFPRWVEILILC